MTFEKDEKYLAADINQIPVNIHLKTVIKQDQEEDNYELMLQGLFYQKGNAAFLKYDEVLEEGTVHTIVKMSDRDAVILRSGAVKMRLSFHADVEKNGSYESPYGTLLLSTRTKKIETSEGQFLLKYDLCMNGEVSGTYEMYITYREAK
ncbi:DUF1934 domain-containing protein [Heyndrickxia sp. NPDC080065]|uniref:DUF1934 domain-containing protein n=1 Tax=Heyndrickxia sp. NPDC080065 TaxID=3390568 RepID=UPI003D014F39